LPWQSSYPGAACPPNPSLLDLLCNICFFTLLGKSYEILYVWFLAQTQLSLDLSFKPKVYSHGSLIYSNNTLYLCPGTIDSGYTCTRFS
jgi:hypothetical protein